jgi:hypothetical protein
VVGALCFSRGNQRLSVARKSSILIMRFSAGLEESRGFRSLRENSRIWEAEGRTADPSASLGMTIHLENDT